MDFRTETNHRPFSVLTHVLWGWAGDVSECEREEWPWTLSTSLCLPLQGAGFSGTYSPVIIG